MSKMLIAEMSPSLVADDLANSTKICHAPSFLVQTATSAIASIAIPLAGYSPKVLEHGTTSRMENLESLLCVEVKRPDPAGKNIAHLIVHIEEEIATTVMETSTSPTKVS